LPNIAHSPGVTVAVGVTPGGSPNASLTSYPIRGKTVCRRSRDVGRDREKMRAGVSRGIYLQRQPAAGRRLRNTLRWWQMYDR
jgi:hypothetical protein